MKDRVAKESRNERTIASFWIKAVNADVSLKYDVDNEKIRIYGLANLTSKRDSFRGTMDVMPKNEDTIVFKCGLKMTYHWFGFFSVYYHNKLILKLYLLPRINIAELTMINPSEVKYFRWSIL